MSDKKNRSPLSRITRETLRFTDYKSTSTRADYWYLQIGWFLILTGISLVIWLASALMMHFVLAWPENGATGEYMINLLGLIVSIGNIVSVVATIFSILPTIAVTNRRLRDL